MKQASGGETPRGAARISSPAVTIGSKSVLTTGVPALDELLEGVRVGDNLVMLADEDVPLRLIGGRFAEAAAGTSPLVVVALDERTPIPGNGALVLDRREHDAGVGELVRALADADAQVGEGASFLVDSLTVAQERWGSDGALELFLGTCPRLYRRGSVAMWLVEAEHHDGAFTERLRDITQVVLALRRDGERLEAEVLSAAGRPPTVIGRRLGLREEESQLVAAGELSSGRDRLGEVVRSQRTTRGMTQAELARRIGISPSALSQVERGVRGLSAERLIRIWEVLGVPFGPQDTLQRGYRVARRSGHRVVELARGATGRELLDDPSVGRCWEVTVEPGASGRQPLFTGKGAEVLLVLRGVLDVQVGAHRETLQEGDSLVAGDVAVEGWSSPERVGAEVIWSVLG